MCQISILTPKIVHFNFCELSDKVRYPNKKKATGLPATNLCGMSSSSSNINQGVLSATQLDHLLSFLSYSFKNKDRTDSLANVGLETLTLDVLCQRFSSVFPLKSDAFKVS